MDKFVKKFIENTKYLISTNQWAPFFYEWYKECDKIWPGIKQEQELFQILFSSEIDVDWDTRKNVIIVATKDNIENLLHYDWRNNIIPTISLTSGLTTRLHCSKTEILSCINTAAKECGLKPTDDGSGYII